ncbi:nucleolar protein 8 [Rhinophrynus dorsalis]
MEATLKRLYVGGIGPSVTDTELAERFGKFGKVNDVDIISRKDEKGNPMKTFAYLNISISETDLTKCMSTLNKTKWKGGVLQIEMAKESFLHRLSQERQAAKKETEPKAESQTDLVHSLKAAGVTDFQMKAAVPGTEVPNHKNWVVSKYGRVLPILHLKGNSQNKISFSLNIMKYDPSKYCHNIKKLEDSSTEMTPVSKLTWHLEGGDDEISRKRRGEFPSPKTLSKKKTKVQQYPDTKEPSDIRKHIQTNQSFVFVPDESSPAHHAGGLSGIRRDLNGPSERKRSKNLMFDDGSDSEEELRTILEREKNVLKKGAVLLEDSNLEVVDESFKLSYNTHWGQGNEKVNKKSQSNCTSKAKDDSEYDSADTDEIIAVAKTVQKKNINSEIKDKNSGNENQGLQPKKQISKLDSAGISGTKSRPKQNDGEDELEMSEEPDDDCGSFDDDDDDSRSNSNDSFSDEEYESMMQNCHRLEISFEDLKKLANAAKESSDDDTVDEMESDQVEKDKQEEVKTSTANLGKKNGIAPEDIVASILEDDDSCDEKPKCKKKISPKLPAFKGLSSLLDKEEELTVSVNSVSSSLPLKYSTHSAAEKSSSNVSSKILEVESNFRATETEEPLMPKRSGGGDGSTSIGSGTSTSESSSDEGSDSATSPATPTKSLQSTGARVGTGKSNSTEQTATRAQNPLIEKQLQDNQKRLAAMEERRKERELQKQAIQGALLKLDSQPSSKGKHIVFDSESESEVEENVTKASDTKRKSAEKVQSASAQLFDSSEDESDDGGEKSDGARFQIKSQYEGRSGEKLLNLQSRFGTDERFRMDSRFLDDSSEDEKEEETKQKVQADEEDDDLSAEKKKNLGILQSLLKVNVESKPLSKQAAKAKKFKDLNALQYDPTREDHAAFETKTEEKNKESKSERKKKRLEAEKLPEVSTETYHEVTADFKEVFGASKPTSAKEGAGMTWDQEEEKEVEGLGSSASQENFSFQEQKEEESMGFTFSFFKSTPMETISKEEPYKIEKIKPCKVAWQEDPRFQDSSSEGEEEDEAPMEIATETSMQSDASKSKVRFFFFLKNDERLKEGPKLFCRSSDLDVEQEAWEQRRESLLEECRKRHKDAKRKIKGKH